MMKSRGRNPDPAVLAGFRRAQRLAYEGVQAVAASLRPGVSEREAARRLRAWLEDHGVRDWFHVPFAWFGDRTTLAPMRNPLRFFPSERRLAEGMPFILDVAPVVEGVAADVGYAGCLGANPLFERMHADLAAHRALVLEGVRARRSLARIYDEVDALAWRQGYRTAHRTYPGRVLAHRVWPVPDRGPRTVVAGFGLRSLELLARSLRESAREGWSPLWNGTRRSEHPPVPGVWAVEPHLALAGVGVKFEELLVVTADGAFYLDDELPHVRRWARAA